jgi:hypothetical protein
MPEGASRSVGMSGDQLHGVHEDDSLTNLSHVPENGASKHYPSVLECLFLHPRSELPRLSFQGDYFD